MARAPEQQSESGEEVVWQAALPALYESLDHLSERERALVLERFFEGRKFSEIAVKTGRSEAACKMGIKRTLEKLSRFLTTRGVTLSATAVASVLTTEFARSAPLQTLAAIAPKALATSGGLTGHLSHHQYRPNHEHPENRNPHRRGRPGHRFRALYAAIVGCFESPPRTRLPFRAA